MFFPKFFVTMLISKYTSSTFEMYHFNIFVTVLKC
jgi:hypothetical protein